MSMTNLTTIKVSARTRDRLKAGAGSRGLSLGDYLEHLVAHAEREVRWKALQEAIDATPTELMDSYRDETAQWEQTELSDADRDW